jgi:hypothetical protein
MLTKGDVLAYLGKASSPTGSFKQSIKDEQKPLQAAKKEDIKVRLISTANGVVMNNVM